MHRHVRWQSVHGEYLKAAYERGELMDRNGVPPEEILELLGLSEEAGDEVLDLLVEAGMIVWPAKGQVLLTEGGLRKAQELERSRQRRVIGLAEKTDLTYVYQAVSLRASSGHLRAARAGE